MFLTKGVSLVARDVVIRSAAPRLMVARSFTIGDTLGKKEKVEEDRYMRELEKKYIETKKAEKAVAMAETEETEFKDKIAPLMAEIEVLLGKSGDSISYEGLEALARWKSGL